MKSNPWTDRAVEAHWDSVANRYILENNKVKKTHDQRFKITLDHLNLQNNNRILNISSRDAEANDYIQNLCPGSVIVNAEISQGLIDEAHRIRPTIHQIKIDTYSLLPFADESFDRIVTLETLEHVENPYKFLSELHRITLPGGRMVLSCPPATSELPYRVYTFLFGGHGEGPHRFLPSREVKLMLSNTNWLLLKHIPTLLFPVGPSWFIDFGEKVLNYFNYGFINELGIRQFYICQKA